MATAALKPIYILHGEDAFLRDASRREIVAAAIGDADPQTCVAPFDATAELADVLDELRTVPFLAPRRVVIVSDADAFVAAHRKALEKYLAKPSETATLILIVSTWKKTTRLDKLARKIGGVLNCSAPGRGSVGRFVTEAAARRDKRIDSDAAQLLAEWIGDDLAALDAEIEKLSLYVGRRASISAADVSAVVSATAGPAAFALTNALTAGDARAALSALNGMLTARGDQFRVLGLITWHLRKAMGVQQLIAEGQSAGAAMRACRVFYGKQEFLAMLRRRSAGALQEDFRRLIRADLGMKTGAAAPATLQPLVMQLCS